MPENNGAKTGLLELFLVFLRLGFTSFGGPIAHLGYMHDEFVVRRRWMGEGGYADLVALCQFLPGPASSQVGMAMGIARRGYWGGLAAWAGFTAPSALFMTLFALGVSAYSEIFTPSLLHGLKVVAVAVVAQAVLTMAQKLCVGGVRVAVMACAAVAMLAFPHAIVQVAMIVAAGLAGLLLFRPENEGGTRSVEAETGGRRLHGAAFIALFFILLFALPLAARWTGRHELDVAGSFYRAGSLVFGGGNVILPLLQAEVVTPGWVSNDAFLAGYGAAQAVPGPLLSFAAFLGASMRIAPGPLANALLCLVAIFLPAFLLIAGALPFWNALRRSRRMQAALAGINAAVVGLLLAALYTPVWTNAIHKPKDFALGLACWLALARGKLPPWLVVIIGMAGNQAFMRLFGTTA